MARTSTKKVNKTVSTPVENKTVIEKIEAEAVQHSAAAAAPAVAKKKHDPEELFMCRSLVVGELVFTSKKTGVEYYWSNYGDEQQVQYQDLLSLMLSRSDFLFKPWFIIEDSSLIDEKEWAGLRKLYMNLYDYDNLDAVLELNDEEFKNALLAAPEGVRNSIKMLVSMRIEEETFDSLNKIKIVEQVLGVKIYDLASK